MYCVRDIHQKLQTMKGLALDSLMALWIWDIWNPLQIDVSVAIWQVTFSSQHSSWLWLFRVLCINIHFVHMIKFISLIYLLQVIISYALQMMHVFIVYVWADHIIPWQNKAIPDFDVIIGSREVCRNLT
jgi:hypothetical protein